MEAREKLFAHQFDGFTPRVAMRISIGNRAGQIHDPDRFWWKHFFQGAAERFDRIREQSVENHDHLMIPAQAH